MSRRYITSIIYGLSAIACSVFMLTRNIDPGGFWKIPILWLSVAATPLLFVFAYPRFLFAGTRSPGHLKYAALCHTAFVIPEYLAVGSYGSRSYKDQPDTKPPKIL